MYMLSDYNYIFTAFPLSSRGIVKESSKHLDYSLQVQKVYMHVIPISGTFLYFLHL